MMMSKKLWKQAIETNIREIEEYNKQLQDRSKTQEEIAAIKYACSISQGWLDRLLSPTGRYLA